MARSLKSLDKPKPRNRIVAKERNDGLAPGYGTSLNREEKNSAFNMMFRTLASELVTRATLADKLGKSYWPSSGGNPQRDLYKTLGYELSPNFYSYYARYRRQDIAKAIVNALPNACWRLKPTISDSEKTDTKFEIELNKIIKEKKVWHYLSRGDRVSGIGEYGGILMGFDDGEDLSKPLKKAGKLLYLRPYTQEFLSVQSFVKDNKDERYGLPEVYQVTTSEGGENRKDIAVHYSRIIHVAEDLVEDDIHGTPRLEIVLNRLHDLELISGGSAEMFWRGAFPGYAFKLDPEAQFDPDQLEDFEDEIQAYLHELRRYIRLQGMSVDSLQVEVSDPSNHIDVLITLISAATRIPKRILLGSERGELASSQDERSWVDRIDERRTDHVENNIIRPFIDTLINTKIVPPPPDGSYAVEWPPLIVMGEVEKMNIAKSATEAIAKYVATPGMQEILPVEMFLKKYMGFKDEEINQVQELLGKTFEEVAEEKEEEKEVMKEQMKGKVSSTEEEIEYEEEVEEEE
jgi:uncharacterized protein